MVMNTVDKRRLSSDDERASFASCWASHADGMGLRNTGSESCRSLHGHRTKP